MAEARTRHIKMYSRLIAAALGLAVVVAVLVFLLRSDSKQRKTVDGSDGREKESSSEPLSAAEASPFEGPSFESSGVAGVPGASGIIFVDDGRPGEIFWMPVNGSGKQAGPIKSIPTGLSIEDPEALAFDGTYFYIAGSQSDPKGGGRNAIGRFIFDADGLRVTSAEAVQGFRNFLLERSPELSRQGDKAGTDGGLNIEGLAWDHRNKELVLGLRSPVEDDAALLFRLELRNPSGPFTDDNLELASAQATRLRLGELGIRDMYYDDRLKGFLIIAGAPKHYEKGRFTLWQWDGQLGEAGLRKIGGLDPRLKPEGITSVEAGGSRFLFIVYDSSSYMKLDYSALGNQ